MINDLARVTSDIINHPLEVSNAAYYANIEVIRMDRDLSEILLATEDYEINILEDSIRTSESRVYTALDTIAYDILGQEGKDLQVEARTLFNDWKTIRTEIIEYVKSGNAERALEISSTMGQDHIEALEQKLVELNQYARKKAENFQENSIELENDTNRVAVFGVLAVFVVIAVTIFWLGYNVLGSINKLSESLSEITRSGEFKEVVLEGHDEFVGLSKIFNHLINSLSSQLWVKEGNRQVAGLINDSESYKVTIRKVMDLMCKYTESLSIIYYAVEDNKVYLEYARNKLTTMEEVYRLNEGIVGEVAYQNEPRNVTYLNQFISQHDLPFSELQLLPVSLNETVFGVVVFAHKQLVSAEEIEFIDESIRDFSFYVAANAQRAQIDSLFNEAVKTNEKLTERQLKLEENQEELQAVNKTLADQRDLLNAKSSELYQQNLELVELREELVNKYQDLEEVTKYRSQFLANISHELRTPLNSVIVLSNILKSKSFDEFALDDYAKIEVINKAANELLLTINDILDLAKVESGKTEIHEEVFSPLDLIDELKSIYEPIVDSKDLKSNFRSLVSEDLFSDRNKISHILTNFISNAIKFTDKGFVSVILDRSDDINYPIKIDVRDSGIGINSDKLEAIFDEFVQSDGSISRTYGGTGLGLSICKNYSRLINARIDVVSELGKGSTFTLYLPSAVLLQESSSNSKVLLDTQLYENKDQLLNQFIGSKVLICDDEPMNVFSLSSMLEDIGVVPIAALSGEEALNIVKTVQVDMILMDLMMPGVDGLFVLSQIKSIQKEKDIPVAIVTAATLSDKEQGVIYDMGYKIVKKPIIYNDIVKVLNENL
jgi:signal transduction histidine kinase